MKLAPALLIVVFALGTVTLTRLAMRGHVVPPEPVDSASSETFGSRPPRSASVTDLVSRYGSLPPDEMRARLQALDIPEETITQAMRARVLADTAQALPSTANTPAPDLRAEVRRDMVVPPPPIPAAQRPTDGPLDLILGHYHSDGDDGKK